MKVFIADNPRQMWAKHREWSIEQEVELQEMRVVTNQRRLNASLDLLQKLRAILDKQREVVNEAGSAVRVSRHGVVG